MELRYTTDPMSASQAATDVVTARELTLDVASFQKLLMAAWVIQCERDRLRDLPDPAESSFPPDLFPKQAHLEIDESDLAAQPVIARGAGDDAVGGIDPSAKLPPARAERMCSDEISGALALAPDCDALMPTGAGLYSVPQVARNAAPKKAGPEVPPRSALIVVPFPARKAQSESAAARFLRSIPASVFICSIVVCFALIAFVTFRIQRHLKRPPTASAVSAKADEHATVAGNPTANLPVLQSSHLRVTDSEISADLAELSRFEMRSIRRQAEFGDDEAALILGMAEEVGQGVPQNCAHAAHSIEIAAKNGNAAAQYNLALRYFYGDGVLADHNESLHWLQAAARHGYGDAQAALAHFSFSR